jgi:hypothetical protein
VWYLSATTSARDLPRRRLLIGSGTYERRCVLVDAVGSVLGNGECEDWGEKEDEMSELGEMGEVHVDKLEILRPDCCYSSELNAASVLYVFS